MIGINMDADHRFGAGKYKGKTVEQVCLEGDFGYLYWARESGAASFSEEPNKVIDAWADENKGEAGKIKRRCLADGKRPIDSPRREPTVKPDASVSVTDATAEDLAHLFGVSKEKVTASLRTEMSMAPDELPAEWGSW